jgi:hypothetical protein
MDQFFCLKALEWMLEPENRWVALSKRLIDELKQFESQLKERTSIDRPAAKFLKSAIDIKEMTVEAPNCIKFPIRYDFLQKESNLCDQIVVSSTPIRGEIYERCNTSTRWDFDVQWSHPQEVDIIPRETISITKEIITYIRSSVKSSFSTVEPLKLSEDSRIQHFIMESSNATAREENTRETNIVRVPAKIELDLETDASYLDERIAPLEVLELALDEKRPETPLEQVMLTSYFVISYENILMGTSAEFNLTFDKITIENVHFDKMRMKELEVYWIEEDLDKGSEFRIDAPFMSDEPVFDQCTDSFDFCFRKLPQRVNVSCGVPLKISDVLPFSAEDTILEENITGEPQEVVSIEYNLYPCADVSPAFIIEIPDKPYSQEPFVPSIESYPVLDENTTLQVTCANNSDILINETIIRTSDLESSKTTLIEGGKASIAMATMEMTRVDKGEGSGKSKHSIDGHLDELMNLKRKKTQRTPFTSPFHNLFEVGNPSMAARLILDENYQMPVEKNIEEVYSFEDPRVDGASTIGFNSSFIGGYQKHIQYLDSHTSVNIVELEMAEDDVEFIISPTCGIMIIEISAIGQIDTNGYHSLHQRLIKGRERYLSLVVMILCDSMTMKDTLTSFQLALSIMDIECIVTCRGVKNVCQWICEICHENGEIWKEERMGCADSNEVKFLVNCGLNPFSAIKVLEHVHLYQFLCMDLAERSLFPFLSPEILSHIDNLFSVEWSIQ